VIVASSRLRSALTSCVLAFGLGSTASAATLDFTYFDRSESAAAQSALDAFQSGAGLGPNEKMTSVKTETFEGHQAWNGVTGHSGPVDTNVGSFSSLGGYGTGNSAVNGGTSLQMRSDNPWVWGRYDTSGVDGNWLDSNDTKGMRWNVSGAGAFNALAFLLTDVADVGAVFSIKVGDTLFSDVVGASGKTGNGSIQFVRILLPEAVDHLTVELRNNRLNDGFGVDGATIARIAPVPVPPAALLLVSGAAALFGLRRRKHVA
jgi:hypothetical protein